MSAVRRITDRYTTYWGLTIVGPCSAARAFMRELGLTSRELDEAG